MITQADIIYFVVTDRFFKMGNSNPTDSTGIRSYHGGNFSGIENKIPYLVELGITALWITPVYLGVGRVGDSDGYHGYWPLDFDKIDHQLDPADNKEGLKRLVEKLHDAGIKVILDMVVNHTGYHNEDYINYTSKKVLPEWFNKGGTGEQKEELSGLPDLNHDLPDVRDYFVNNIIDWVEETGIDAIRMDTVKHVEDAFWYTFKSYVRGKYQNVSLIGEVLDINPESIARYQTKMDFDTVFDFPLQNVIMDTLVREGSLTRLARKRLFQGEESGILDKDTQYYNNANRLITLLDNHDLDMGRIKTAILQHVGEWDRDLCMKILKCCIGFLFTTRGIPQIYYGTEIGLEGGKDPWNRGNFRWDYLEESNQDFQAKEARILLAFMKSIIGIRKSRPSLMFGSLYTLYVDHFLYVYMREFRGDIVIVAINNGRSAMSSPVTIHLSDNTNIPSRIKDLCQGKKLENLLKPGDILFFTGGNLDFKLEGKEISIWHVQT